MPTENQNNWIHFRIDLDQVDRFPEEPPYNKAGGWDKLDSRLQEDFSKRRNILGWAAAAAILLIAGLGWVYFQTPARNFTEVAVRKPNEAVTVGETHTRYLTDTVHINGSEFRGISRSSHSVPYNRPNKPHRKPSTSRASIAVLTPPANAQTSPIFSLEPVPDSSNLVAIIHPTVPIRRLKVIHNNRLNSVIYKPELSIGDAGIHRPSTTGYLQFGRNLSDNIIQVKLPSIN